MDAVSGLLDGPRARGAFLLHSTLRAPWCLKVADEAPLTVVAVVAGRAHVVPDGGTPTRLGPGDLAVVRGPGHYLVCDHPATPPDVVILPGQRCVAVDGAAVKGLGDLGARRWGNCPDGEDVLLTGTYQLRHEVGGRLLDALPPLLVSARDGRHRRLLALLAEELGCERPGQQAVLDRVLDLLLIAVLRAWLDRPEAAAPGWYRAYGDPVVGPALRLIHADPSAPWTVAALAREAGVSRATLARRFTELVGEPPISYLTGWRLTLAADLLGEPEATVGRVARRVGYGSPFAFSAAFKRRYGVAPRDVSPGRHPAGE